METRVGRIIYVQYALIFQQNPLFLTCAHSFCSHCLSNALHLHNQCPVCRKEQTLDPKNYGVSKVLETFIRRNFPTFHPAPHAQKNLISSPIVSTLSTEISPLSCDISFEDAESLELGASVDLDKNLCWNALGFDDVDKQLLGPVHDDLNLIKKTPPLDLLFGSESLPDPF
eukprot:TRINITY_DN13003_c0_g1_i1.p1 TRINITY_DN13003_c0_g1~~TRINITY_DN13003_c0_g1_i1.p1  ORF type:complete len:171 (+),score=17.12 TRINITY_DN13003_c0_g1_i1:221-733(+)